MKRILVLGAAGFLGSNLVKRLKKDGHYVRGIDRKMPEFEKSPADEFLTFDLRQRSDTLFESFDEVYQLAAEVGGLGYIMNQDNDAEMLHNSMQINISVLQTCRFLNPPPKIFFASSACVYPSLSSYDSYRDIVPPSQGCRESDAYPAHPGNEYAWEKLFSERLYDAYARNYGLQVRIGRFHNTFGPLGTYKGGREKAPAALIRKVLEATNGTSIDIWGDGTATRSFMYVDDAVEGMIRLMASDFQGPVNIGSSRMISILALAQMIATIGGKMLEIKSTSGPVGVAGRCSDNSLIKEKLGWEPVFPLELGLVHTMRWIATQMKIFRPDGTISVPDLEKAG